MRLFEEGSRGITAEVGAGSLLVCASPSPGPLQYWAWSGARERHVEWRCG